MTDAMARRRFLGVSAATALGATLGNTANAKTRDSAAKPLRVGLIGIGRRGTGLLGIVLAMKDVTVAALCDTDPQALARGLGMVEKAGQRKPHGYGKTEDDYRRLLERHDVDAVLIATPWHWHTPMAVHAMRCGKYVGVEVPCALSYDQCWELVKTHEDTKIPCMMLENWSFRRDNLAVLRMIREGLLGDIVHCHCAHSHDCIDHWFFDEQGNRRWGADYLINYNRDQYPTHSLGPVLSWLDINCGDAFATVTSTATDSRAINHYFATKFGPDHPNAKQTYKQGDIVTSVLRTHKGKTVVVNYDMQLPRPYDNRWMVQGLKGIYDEDKASVYLKDLSPKYHEWEPFPPYQDKCEHPWWAAMKDAAGNFSHGGTDYLELSKFFEAVRNKTQTPIDVYDSVTMSSLVPLSEDSIAKGGAPVPCPDFTNGAWATRKPVFAV